MRKTSIWLHRRSLITALAAALTISAMLCFPSEAVSAAGGAVSAWLTVILPSLMPFAIISSVLTGTGVVYALCRRLERICRCVFGFSGLFLYVLICSCISGYPLGAKLTADLRREGALSAHEASAFIRSASTSGPLFLMGSVAVGILGDASLSPLLLGCHYASVLITALINGAIYRRNSEPFSSVPRRSLSVGTGALLSSAVSGAISGMLTVLGYMVLFTTAAKMLDICALSSLLPQWGGALLTGILELASGCVAAGSLPNAFALVAVSFFAGFGGLSVIAQTYSFASSADIKCRGLFFSKLMQGGLAALICSFFVSPVSPVAICSSFILFAAGLLCLLLLLIKKKPNGNGGEA